MTNAVYAAGKEDLATSSNWTSSDYRIMLVTSSYVFDGTESTMASASTYEVDESTSTIASKAITLDTANNQIELTGDAVTLSAVTGSDATAFIVFKYNGAAHSGNIPFVYVDNIATIIPDGGDIVVTATDDIWCLL